MRSLRRVTVVVVLVASLSACKDLTSIDASIANVTKTDSVFAINGSPPGAPTAVNLFSSSFFRADQGFRYDLAFDIGTDGKAVLIPARALASTFAQPYSVGLQVIPGTFDALTDAPKSGYTVDSVFTVDVGTVIAIESHDVSTCAYAIKGSSYFSKLVVTNIDLLLRRITVMLTVNRNCGFRSFSPGIPKS